MFHKWNGFKIWEYFGPEGGTISLQLLFRKQRTLTLSRQEKLTNLITTVEAKAPAVRALAIAIYVYTRMYI